MKQKKKQNKINKSKRNRLVAFVLKKKVKEKSENLSLYYMFMLNIFIGQTLQVKRIKFSNEIK